MKNFVRKMLVQMGVMKLHKILVCSGINLEQVLQTLRGVGFYVNDYFVYKRLSTSKSMPISLKNILPILVNKHTDAGVAKGHYFHQDLWAARKVFQKNPKRHVDIGSSVDGFIAHLLTFREVEVIDIRQLDSNVDGLKFVQDDATTLGKFDDNSLESISTLHAGEHFGLGRYGDKVDPDAHIKFMKSLQRVLKPGGTLYFSVPCGKERLEFNGHRIFSPHTVLREFDELKRVSIDGVMDDGDYYKDIDINELANQYHGCGFFEFTK